MWQLATHYNSHSSVAGALQAFVIRRVLPLFCTFTGPQGESLEDTAGIVLARVMEHITLSLC